MCQETVHEEDVRILQGAETSCRPVGVSLDFDRASGGLVFRSSLGSGDLDGCAQVLPHADRGLQRNWGVPVGLTPP